MAYTQKYTPVELSDIFGTTNANFGNLTDAIKAYVDNKASLSEADIKTLIAAGDTELRSLIAADADRLAALVAIMDNVDGTVDGEITIASIITSLQAQDTKAAKDILGNSTLIASVQGLLNKEISDRTNMGTTLTQAITDAKDSAVQLIKDLDLIVQDLLSRVSALEIGLTASVAAQANMADGMIRLGQKFNDDIAKFALPVAPATNPNVVV